MLKQGSENTANATIALSAHAGVLLPQLDATLAPKLNVLKSRAEQFGLTNESATAGSVDALVIRDPRPFHPERLYEACRSKLGTVFIVQGFLWLASRPGQV